MKKPENLLEAVNDLDEEIIEDALSSPVISFRKRKALRALMAAALVAAMSLTVYAVHSLSQWYQNYFAQQSQLELNENQKTYLDENVIEVAPQQPGLTVESALTDGIRIFMKLRVTAPEDVELFVSNEEWNVQGKFENDLNGLDSDPLKADVVTLDGKKAYNSFRYLPVEDGDGQANTMDYVAMGMLEGPVDTETWKELPLELAGKSLKVHFHDFYQSMWSNKTNESKEEKVLEGDWTFEIPITEENLKVREMISDPVKASMEYMDMEAEEKTMLWKENVPVTFVRLRALTIDIGYYWPRNGGSFGHEIKAVMENGEEIPLYAAWGGGDFVRYEAQAPIIIDQVDHLILGDGTVIYAS